MRQKPDVTTSLFVDPDEPGPRFEETAQDEIRAARRDRARQPLELNPEFYELGDDFTLKT